MLTVLLVRFSSIGDILLTTPLVRALRRRHPDAQLVYVTKRALTPLVADNPNVSRVVALEPGEPVTHLAARLRTLEPTHGLDLHGSLRSLALRALLRCRWSGYSKHRLARAVLVRLKRDVFRGRTPVPERYFEAARRLGVRPDASPPEFFLGAAARARVHHWMREHGLKDRPLVALAPGAAHATKRWPIANWVSAAERLRDAGVNLVVVGGPDDRGAAQQLAPLAELAAGEFTLQETGALLAHARAVVSGDTGVMHMATGVGTPVVALFGPTVEQFGFFPYRARATVLQRDLTCRPCSTMGSARCPLGHHRCLRDIAPAEVTDAVLRFVA